MVHYACVGPCGGSENHEKHGFSCHQSWFMSETTRNQLGKVYRTFWSGVGHSGGALVIPAKSDCFFKKCHYMYFNLVTMLTCSSQEACSHAAESHFQNSQKVRDGPMRTSLELTASGDEKTMIFRNCAQIQKCSSIYSHVRWAFLLLI